MSPLHNDPGTLGTPFQKLGITGSVPGLGNVRTDVVVPTQGASVGDTVYYLIHSPFSVEVMNTTANAQRYANVFSKFKYRELAVDYLYRIIFDTFSYRTEPSQAVIDDIISIIHDVGRMLAILFSAYAMKQSRDPEMFRRARILGLHDSIPEMVAMLEALPCPKGVASLTSQLIGLGEVSGNPLTYQNVGFLCAGDYNAFLTLRGNVQSKPLALNFMRKMYPTLGLVGDPGPRTGPDYLETFINAFSKKSDDGTFCNWVSIPGSSGYSQQLASAGLFHSTYDVTTQLNVSTLTGWAIPGSGINNAASQRTPWPALCRWTLTGQSTGSDAAISRTLTQTYSAAANPILAETVLDLNLCANLAHEYQMMQDSINPPANWTSFNTSTGANSSPLPFLTAGENTRYRTSSGMQLGSLSYRLDGNMMAGLYAMLAS